MIKNIYYKEWVKTRRFLVVMFVAVLGVTAYGLLGLNRIYELKEAQHLWEVIVSKDALFVDVITYVPLLTGLLMGITQFAPEMYHKCLKLTLHLPCHHLKMINAMLSFGVVMLLGAFALSMLMMFVYMQGIMPVEFYGRILISTVPWYLAGLAAYLLMAWVCLEPTWRRRVFNIVVSLLVLRVYFLAQSPEAYNGFLPLLTVFTILTASLSWLSVARFKIGCQD
jgi:hypothetical protein